MKYLVGIGIVIGISATIVTSFLILWGWGNDSRISLLEDKVDALTKTNPTDRREEYPPHIGD